MSFTVVGLGPVTSVGEVTNGGKGNSDAVHTASLNGTVHKGVTVSGTYAVNLDCTATHAESDGSHYSYLFTPDGNKVTWIETVPGVVISGTEIRLQPADTDDAVLVSPRNREAVQVPPGSAASPESLSIARLALKNGRSDRSFHV